MQKPITLCDRCEHAGGCLLEYDEGTCRKLRTAEPTNSDILRQKSDEELADQIFFELSQFMDVASLLTWLNSPAGKQEADRE